MVMVPHCNTLMITPPTNPTHNNPQSTNNTHKKPQKQPNKQHKPQKLTQLKTQKHKILSNKSTNPNHQTQKTPPTRKELKSKSKPFYESQKKHTHGKVACQKKKITTRF